MTRRRRWWTSAGLQHGLALLGLEATLEAMKSASAPGSGMLAAAMASSWRLFSDSSTMRWKRATALRAQGLQLQVALHRLRQPLHPRPHPGLRLLDGQQADAGHPLEDGVDGAIGGLDHAQTLAAVPTSYSSPW